MLQSMRFVLLVLVFNWPSSVHAARQLDKNLQFDESLELEMFGKNEEELNGPSALDSTRVPDAVSKSCRHGMGTSLFRHLRLGNYTPEEVMQAQCDEPLLVLLQRELLRMQNMESYCDKDMFEEKFPQEFMLDKKNFELIKSTVIGSLSALTVASPIKLLPHAVKHVDDLLINGDLLVEYAAFCGGTLMDELQHPDRHAKTLVEKGAKGTTAFWQDVPLGALQDVYRIVTASWRSMRLGEPITVRDVKMFSESNSVKKELRVLKAGTMLSFARADLVHAQTRSPEFPVRKLSDPERVVAHGFVLVRVGVQEGWVEEDAVAPWAWLTYKGSKKLPVCVGPKEACSKDTEIMGYIHGGQTFKVEGFGKYWMVLGSGGFIPKSTSKLIGPLSPQDAWQAQNEAKTSLALEGKAIKDGRVLSGFSEFWESKTTTHAKFLLGIAIAIGGILSHGLGFLIAGVAHGVGTASTDAALAVKLTEQILSQVMYMELALLQFERDLVSGATNHQRCDAQEGNRAALCPEGFTCMRKLAFLFRENQDDHRGWCVHAPYSNLEATGKPCSVDVDCVSGVCNLNRGGKLVNMLSGTCA